MVKKHKKHSLISLWHMAVQHGTLCGGGPSSLCLTPGKGKHNDSYFWVIVHQRKHISEYYIPSLPIEPSKSYTVDLLSHRTFSSVVLSESENKSHIWKVIANRLRMRQRGSKWAAAAERKLLVCLQPQEGRATEERWSALSWQSGCSKCKRLLEDVRPGLALQFVNSKTMQCNKEFHHYGQHCCMSEQVKKGCICLH